MLTAESNKKKGSDFEKEFCEKLKSAGYWVHFISPDNRGAQPFDIIAARYGFPFAIDCKTSVKRNFSIDRLEDNQIMAFEKWMSCGNNEPFVAVSFEGEIYLVPYTLLKRKKVVKLGEDDEIFMWE